MTPDTSANVGTTFLASMALVILCLIIGVGLWVLVTL
jgi:hypothetical protein